MTRHLLLCLLLAPCAAGCKHASSSSSSTHTETSTVTDSTSSETGAQTTVTTTSEAPGETTTTVEDYAPPAKDAEPSVGVDSDGGVDTSRAAANVTSAGRHSNPPILIRRTVTVTKSGGETTQTRQEATQQGATATETHAQAQGDTKTQASKSSAPSAGCIGASWIWGIAALVFAAALIFGLLKFRKTV